MSVHSGVLYACEKYFWYSLSLFMCVSVHTFSVFMLYKMEAFQALDSLINGFYLWILYSFLFFFFKDWYYWKILLFCFYSLNKPCRVHHLESVKIGVH